MKSSATSISRSPTRTTYRAAAWSEGVGTSSINFGFVIADGDKPRLTDQAWSDRPSTPCLRAHAPRLSPAAFAAFTHARASRSSQIFRIARTLAASRLAVIPVSLMNHVATYVPFLGLYGILLHANVTWTFGPLRYVIASPAFHRWHHTSEEAGLDKNFAGLLPIWDLLFRTFYLPGQVPRVFGVRDAIPDGFVGQMTWPFRRDSRRRATPATAQFRA